MNHQIKQSIGVENVINVYELSCYDSRKSFYGKATVLETESGYYLKSYDTIVCYFSRNGEFIRLWDGYSATTMRHINSFLLYCRVSGCYGGKAWWDELTPDKQYKIA